MVSSFTFRLLQNYCFILTMTVIRLPESPAELVSVIYRVKFGVASDEGEVLNINHIFRCISVLMEAAATEIISWRS